MPAPPRFRATQTLKHPNTVNSLSVQFSNDGAMLCVGGFDGQIRQYNATLGFKQSNSVINSAMTDGHDLQSPITSIRFRPVNSTFSAKNVILVTCSDGNITHWHIGSQKELHSMREENEVYCSDYSPDGLAFVTGGKDSHVRLYDEERRTLHTAMSQGTIDGATAHSSRIQQVKFSDNNTVVSAGWDRTLQIWDLRQSKAVRSIYGPYICGDALDVKDGKVLCGSTRPDNQLELFDLGSGELMHSIEWPNNPNVNPDAPDKTAKTDIWAAKFSESGRFIAAGGNTDFRVFDSQNDFKEVGDLLADDRPFVGHCVFSIDWKRSDDTLVVANGGGEVVLLSKY